MSLWVRVCVLWVSANRLMGALISLKFDCSSTLCTVFAFPEDKLRKQFHFYFFLSLLFVVFISFEWDFRQQFSLWLGSCVQRVRCLKHACNSTALTLTCVSIAVCVCMCDNEYHIVFATQNIAIGVHCHFFRFIRETSIQQHVPHAYCSLLKQWINQPLPGTSGTRHSVEK